GSDDFNLHGTMAVRFSNESAPNFELHLDGGATAFGYDFASIGADVQINGSSVDISAYVSVSFYFFSIGGTVHIHLGSLANVPVPPPPVLAQTVTYNGLTYLQLNLGQDSGDRNLAAQSDEDYEISLISGTGGTQTVSVYAPGIYNSAITYNNIQGILVNNTNDS